MALPPFESLDEIPANRDYVIAGGEYHPQLLFAAYRSGVFPWPDPSEPEIIWASPAQRGILFFDRVHVSRSLEKFRRKSPFRFTRNHELRRVMTTCAQIARDGQVQAASWITPDMIEAYVALGRAGYVHSVEVWSEERLVGGVYGFSIDGMFFAESMFHIESNASKLAVLELVDALTNEGCTWMDIQMLTPVTEALGGITIPRAQFLALLDQSRRPNYRMFAPR